MWDTYNQRSFFGIRYLKLEQTHHKYISKPSENVFSLRYTYGKAHQGLLDLQDYI